MSDIMSMAALGEGGALGDASAAALKLAQELSQREIMQKREHVAQTMLKNRSHIKELYNERIRMVAASADQTIANAQSQRLLDKLTSKFKLISEMQRSLG